MWNWSPYNYVFALKEIAAGKGELRPLMMLAISPGDETLALPGETTVEPTFGLPARWIAPALAEQARLANWTVVDPATVLTTHLAEVVKENISEFLSYTEAQKILSGLPQEQQKLVADLVPSTITVGGSSARVADAAWPSGFRSAICRRSWRRYRRLAPTVRNRSGRLSRTFEHGCPGRSATA